MFHAGGREAPGLDRLREATAWFFASELPLPGTSEAFAAEDLMNTRTAYMFAQGAAKAASDHGYTHTPLCLCVGEHHRWCPERFPAEEQA